MPSDDGGDGDSKGDDRIAMTVMVKKTKMRMHDN